MSRSTGRVAVVLVIIAGSVLRFATVSPLWLDEALSVHIATGDASLTEALRQDGHPALFYLLLGWWIDVFGDGDTAVRALSGVLSLITVPVIWMATRRYGRDVAIATLLLVATSPYLIRYATETRMYALVVLIIALGWWAFEAAWEQPTARRLLAVAAITAAAVHTHYWTFYAIAAAGLIVVMAGRRTNKHNTAARLLLAMAAGAATFIVWLGVFIDQLAETGTPWATRARPTEVFIETLQGIGGNNRFEGESLGVLLGFSAVLGMLTLSPARAQVLQLRSSIHPSMQVPRRPPVWASGSVPQPPSFRAAHLRPGTPPSPSPSSCCWPGVVSPCSTPHRGLAELPRPGGLDRCDRLRRRCPRDGGYRRSLVREQSWLPRLRLPLRHDQRHAA